MNIPLTRFGVALLLSISIISVCNAGTDNINVSRFKPYQDALGKDAFDFETDSALFFKDSDADAEASRMSLLDEWMTNSGYCQNGYVITYRKAIKLSSVEGHSRIFYSGRCK